MSKPEVTPETTLTPMSCSYLPNRRSTPKSYAYVPSKTSNCHMRLDSDSRVNRKDIALQ